MNGLCFIELRKSRAAESPLASQHTLTFHAGWGHLGRPKMTYGFLPVEHEALHALFYVPAGSQKLSGYSLSQLRFFIRNSHFSGAFCRKIEGLLLQRLVFRNGSSKIRH